jgi:hypothetical protein
MPSQLELEPLCCGIDSGGGGDDWPANFGVSGFHYFWTATDGVTRMDPQDSYRAAI